MGDLSQDEKNRIFDYIDRQTAQSAQMQTDIKWIKEYIGDQKKGKRWIVTTWVAIVAAVIGAVATLKAWFGGP